MQNNLNLFTNEGDIRQRLNQELSNSVDSTQRLINAQNLLANSMQTTSSTGLLTDRHIVNFQEQEDQYLGRYNGHFLEYQYPEEQNKIFEPYEIPSNLLNNNLNEDFSRIESYLEEIKSYQQQRASQESRPNNINFSPTINVSGNVVADERFVKELSENIKNEVYDGITQAVERATHSNGMSYAS